MGCPISEPSPARPADGCAIRGLPRPDPGQRPGHGRLATARVDGASALVACAATSPLQLLSPVPRGRAAWVVMASHGGGLVAGDDVALEVDVGAGSAALLSTQAGTKVYRSPRGTPASQRLDARVGPGGLLAAVPHPVSCFAGARLLQAQRFALAPDASLVWLDALTAGRAARGERWAFAEVRTRVEISAGGRLLLADGLRLVAGEGPPIASRLADVELLATAVLLGPAAAGAAAALLAELERAPVAPGAEVLAAASPLAGGLLLRLAARSVEAGLSFLRARLAFLEAAAGADPFARTP
ncbi:urease accessory protein UreD [Anaeromyxobacter sp. PSR-1]|uniref:urease accessory protein UreD n=1 Tax=unclassified Anaeromyxobacter TaxID=2620896 RepID=UPI0005E72453|nr:urease accessory protein UreD [Anaeromyxobacter sp. PSR-1]GAO02895.1 urease accessory protein UreD [Anaeromyxobacter sp. PSR-1]